MLSNLDREPVVIYALMWWSARYELSKTLFLLVI